MQEPQKDYYGLLGVKEDAREADIKKVYRRLALRYHPDKNSNDENADFNFKFSECRVQLKEAYDVLINVESRELYDLKRDVWGVIPCEFLPPAVKAKPPVSESATSPRVESNNETLKEAFRRARAREQLEAERLRVEKEIREQEEAARLAEQEKLQALAAERIRAAREAMQEQSRLEEERRQQARDQERLHRMAAENIRAQRDSIAREEARRRRQEEAEEIMREYYERIKREEDERRREEEEEFEENLRQFGRRTPKGIAPNNWSDAEIECLLEWKHGNMTWAGIAEKMNTTFSNDRSVASCRKKWVKLERAGAI